MSPMTALNSDDAEDLREFLEAERRRKHLYGSDDKVEEEVEVQNQESEVVEHKIVDLVSEDELENWDVDEPRNSISSYSNRMLVTYALRPAIFDRPVSVRQNLKFATNASRSSRSYSSLLSSTIASESPAAGSAKKTTLQDFRINFPVLMSTITSAS